jgi:hypothetical protein
VERLSAGVDLFASQWNLASVETNLIGGDASEA